jgi:hypothetical protein
VNPVILIGFTAMFLVALAARSDEADPYWLDLVRFELTMRGSEMNVRNSFAQKSIPKLGDCAGIALLKLIDTSAEIAPKVIEASLSIMRDGFSAPDFIAVNSDKEPKICLFLLSVFEQRSTDQKILSEIQQTKNFLLSIKTHEAHSP